MRSCSLLYDATRALRVRVAEFTMWKHEKGRKKLHRGAKEGRKEININSSFKQKKNIFRYRYSCQTIINECQLDQSD